MSSTFESPLTPAQWERAARLFARLVVLPAERRVVVLATSRVEARVAREVSSLLERADRADPLFDAPRRWRRLCAVRL